MKEEKKERRWEGTKGEQEDEEEDEMQTEKAKEEEKEEEKEKEGRVQKQGGQEIARGMKDFVLEKFTIKFFLLIHDVPR